MSKLLLLFLLSGCAFFISKIDKPLLSEKTTRTNPREVKTYCPLEKNFHLQLIGTNEASQLAYLAQEMRVQKFDFIDHFALWSLIQLSIRPDQSSPTSRLQVIFHEKGKSFYFDFFSEESTDQYPYLYGIEWILKKFGRKTPLEYYASIIDADLVRKLKIGKDLANFLFKNRDLIKASPELYPTYFRGTEVLQEEESSPVFKYTDVIREYRRVEKLQKIVVNTSLTQFVTERGNSGSCNYDFNLYDNSIFLIDKIIPVANLYGLALGNSAFMASSSQKLDKLDALKGFPLFKGESKIRSSAVCVIESENSKIWTFSNQSRDPGQHLFHLIRYGLPRSQSVTDVDLLIRHSRHLFLSDPVRLIIESGRSKPAQVENLLKLNLPIYNSEKLGNIWAYTLFKGQNRFIIDDRNPGAFVCR